MCIRDRTQGVTKLEVADRCKSAVNDAPVRNLTSHWNRRSSCHARRRITYTHRDSADSNPPAPGEEGE
eukprot:14917620-Alexandrium_andersonii.AAC.1